MAYLQSTIEFLYAFCHISFIICLSFLTYFPQSSLSPHPNGIRIYPSLRYLFNYDIYPDGRSELWVEQPAEPSVVAAEQLAKHLSSHLLVHGSFRRRRPGDLVFHRIPGSHHHLVPVHRRGGCGGGGHLCFYRLLYGIAHDAWHVSVCLPDVRNGLKMVNKIFFFF